MGGGASSSLHAVSNLRLGETSRCKLPTTPANPQAEGGACRETELVSWGHGLSPFSGDKVRHPSLQENDQLHNHSLGVGSRQEALRSPSPQDLGRSQAFQSKGQSSHPAPVSIGAWVEECELCKMHDQLRSDMQSLRECVDTLVTLIHSHHEENRRNFQELREAKGEANRVDFTQNKQQQQLEQQE